MNLWKHKLAALLHDPPCQGGDLAGREQLARTLFRQAGFTEEEIPRLISGPDWPASILDRFPNLEAGDQRAPRGGMSRGFCHPFSGPPSGTVESPTDLPFNRELGSGESPMAADPTLQPIVQCPSDWTEDQVWRARFFAHWRLYAQQAVEWNYRLGFLPADPQLPNATVWNHMQVVSALAGCTVADDPRAPLAPAFLKLQIGPVQEFIAPARGPGDLWSGSYLLSWLMTAGLRALSQAVGPDTVIYPSLQNQPVFDLHWRKELWEQVRLGNQSVWDGLKHEPADLAVSHCPHCLVALVPASQARSLAETVVKAIRAEWAGIVEACWQFCQQAGLTADENGLSQSARRERFFTQTVRFPSLDWQVTPWPMTQLNHPGLAWSALYALNAWQLETVRHTRPFDGSVIGDGDTGVFNNQDSLTGRDDAVAGGREWAQRIKAAGTLGELFPREDWLGALTLVKRVWPPAYLEAVWDLHLAPMPSSLSLAAHDPWGHLEGGSTDARRVTVSGEKAYAVLALNADEMGRWVGGDHAPSLAHARAVSAEANSPRDSSPDPDQDPRPLEERVPPWLALCRPVLPSFHLQFNEALNHFARFCLRPIVEVFAGRLIYAGGDDALALLPADMALACAQALRWAFQGRPELTEALRAAAAAKPEDRRGDFDRLALTGALLSVYESQPGVRHPGFLIRDDRLDHNRQPIPFIVPGPAAEVSVGLAMAHFQCSLQDVVRAAQAAEIRAKSELGRSAVAVTWMKPSGETSEWGCHWESGGLELYHLLMDGLEQTVFSPKFPNRLAGRLAPYLTDTTSLAGQAIGGIPDFPMDEVVLREFRAALEREPGEASVASRERFLREEQPIEKMAAYLAGIKADPEASSVPVKLKALMGLCQMIAWVRLTAEATPRAGLGATARNNSHYAGPAPREGHAIR